MSEDPQQRFIATVLAGDRTASDPVALAAGTLCKAIAPIANRPMILRVLDALQESGRIGSIILCGPAQEALTACPELAQRIADDDIHWIATQDSPARSAAAALMQIDAATPVLLTSADHALLDAEIVRDFLQQSTEQEADASFGIIDYQLIQQAFPEVKRTVMRLQDGDYCSCNLFAFMTAEGRRLVPFWQNVEQRRKHPWRMVAGIMGFSATLAYVLGRLALPQVLSQLSRRLELNLSAVLLPYARAGIDVDTPEDREFVKRLLAREES